MSKKRKRIEDVNKIKEAQHPIEQQEVFKAPDPNSLNEVRQGLEDEKEKTNKIEQLFDNIKSLSQSNDVLKQKNQHINNFKNFWFIILLAVAAFLCFCAKCSWYLLSHIKECSTWQQTISIIIGVIMVLLVMAAILMYTAHKTPLYLSQKNEIN